MTKYLKYLLPLVSAAIISCGGHGKPDAYGIIDAHGWMIASSEPGQIVSLNVFEGARVEKGSEALRLDTARLALQYKALESQIKALQPTLPDVGKQLDVMYSRRKAIENERARIRPLVESGSVSSKQLDEVEDQLRVLDSQISAMRSNLSRESAAVLANIESLRSQADIVRDQIERCLITCPESGTVTALYIKLHEFVSPGLPIFKLTDYDHPYVDAWLEGGTVSGLSLGDSLTVGTDIPGGGLKMSRGRVSFIAGEAEFTPNKVMTRDSRTKQVYRIRIELPGGEGFKPGMPAEVFISRRP